jgi:hypothetical protein
MGGNEIDEEIPQPGIQWTEVTAVASAVYPGGSVLPELAAREAGQTIATSLSSLW